MSDEAIELDFVEMKTGIRLGSATLEDIELEHVRIGDVVLMKPSAGAVTLREGIRVTLKSSASSRRLLGTMVDLTEYDSEAPGYGARIEAIDG